MNRKQMILVVGSFAVVAVLIGASMFLEESGDDDRTNVVATFYPLAYMAETIGGDRVSVSSMVPYNSELHIWQPSPKDIINADKAQVILYNGGPADAWLVSDVLPAIDSSGKLVVNTTEGVDFITGGHEHDGDEHEEGDVDPHTWLSPRRAQVQALNVYQALCQADPEGEEYFTARFATLNQTLATLDSQYGQLSQGSVPGIIVAHSAFGYLAHDYGFEQHGVVGMSADEDISGAALIALANMMEEEGIFTVFVDPVYNQNYGLSLKGDLESRTEHQVTIRNIFLALGPYQSYDYIDQLTMNLLSLKAGLGVQ